MLNVGSNYVAHELLGTGGTGAVWRGADRAGSPVAIKILHPEFSGRRDVVRRFIQERELLTEIDHRHVVRVHDLVYDGGTLAIIMDLVTGGDLAKRLHRDGAMSLDLTRSIAAGIAMGLAAIHAADIVHLDLKPGNVLIQPPLAGATDLPDDEHVLIADLGVSQLAQGPAGVAEHPRFGTPQYTAPEIVEGGSVGSAADVYALGLLMVEMLEGLPAFGASDPEDVFGILESQVSETVPRPAAADDPTWELISAMIAKDPDERPTAAEVALELGVTAEDLDTTAFTGAASALGGTAVGAERTTIRLDAPVPPEESDTAAASSSPRTAKPGSDSPTVNLGHRTSILRSAQTVRLGDRGSRTIALPLGLQPGSSLENDAPGDRTAETTAPPGESVPRRGRRTALVVMLGLVALAGAVVLGTFLPLGGPDDPPTTGPTTATSPGAVTVADVSGMTEADAREALGTDLEVRSVKVPGDPGEEGLVRSTSPEAGSTVEPGDVVTLEVATELETRPLSSLPANTAGGRTEEGSVTVDGETTSDAIVVRANKPEVQVTYMVQARYTSADATLVAPDEGTSANVVIEVDGETIAEESLEPGESMPLAADLTDAQRLTITATASDETSSPVIAFMGGTLAGEAGTIPGG